MSKIIRLTEQDLYRIVKRVISEQFEEDFVYSLEPSRYVVSKETGRTPSLLFGKSGYGYVVYKCIYNNTNKTFLITPTEILPKITELSVIASMKNGEIEYSVDTKNIKAELSQNLAYFLNYNSGKHYVFEGTNGVPVVGILEKGFSSITDFESKLGGDERKFSKDNNEVTLNLFDFIKTKKGIYYVKFTSQNMGKKFTGFRSDATVTFTR